MNITICDLCREREPLEPKTGRYVVIVRHITSAKNDSETYNETEYDACGACMEKMRKQGLK